MELQNCDIFACPLAISDKVAAEFPAFVTAQAESRD